MALYENKAFCRYFCPVGRTVGVYSQLAPIALRPVDDDICLQCETLDCYHGSSPDSGNNIAACPTRLVMGRLQESTYCTSCGNCTQSCPSQNINWVLRSPSVEAIQEARPHFDEAFFMLTLLVLTSFHGVTMLQGWQLLVSRFAQTISDSGQLLVSFSVGLLVCWLLPISLYFALTWLSAARLKSTHRAVSVGKMFSGFAFASIPLAFSYHIAHNLNHLLREGSDWPALLANPLGIDALPLSMVEKHQRMMAMWMSQESLFTLQALLLVVGFYLAIQVVRYRASRLFALRANQLIPIICFALVVTGFNLWLLMQDMVMRM
jgi:ferredoxin